MLIKFIIRMSEMILKVLEKMIYQLMLFCWRRFNWKPNKKKFFGNCLWMFSEKLTFDRTQIIYLKNLGLLYYAIPKVANSSIKSLLAKELNLTGDISRKGGLAYLFNNKVESKKLFSEGILVTKRQALELQKSGAESFTVVRDPIKRLESFYNTCNVSSILMKNLIRFYGKNSFWLRMTFEEFSNSVCLIPDIISNRHFLSQNSFIKYKGEIVVNYIFRLENLDTEFSNFLIKKGLNFEKIKNVNQGKIKTTKTHNKSLMIKLKDRYKNDYKLLKQSI